MKQRSIILAFFLVLAFASFAQTMIPCKIFSIKDGSAMTCSFELSTGQGRIEAFNEKTQERFAGRYTAIFVNTIMGKGEGYLIGDKGTIIFLSTLEFSKGTVWVLPVFYGDGEDNNGVKYQIQSNSK
jgi:hypothetical protein